MPNIIQDAIDAVRDVGLNQSAANLEKEKQRCQDEKSRVSVVGQFKAGKSTLINRVFLQEDLLFTDLTEATAVPTELDFGPEKRLEVYHYRTPKAGSAGTEVEGTTVEEDEPYVTANPSKADIRSATSSDTPEGRARLAETTARVRLLWSAEVLKGLTIVDTPGINSGNEAVIQTTYRVVPQSDVVIFVTPARQLDRTDMEFLKSQVFAEAFSRCMIVINHDPLYFPADNERLDSLCTTIQQQLAGLDRKHIPVEVVTLRSADKGGDMMASFKQLAKNFQSVLLGTKNAESLDHFSQALVTFIRANVKEGRQERMYRTVRYELIRARQMCDTELTALDQSEAERKILREKVTRESDGVRKKFDQVGRDYLVDLKDIQEDHERRIIKALDLLGQSYMEQLSSCDSFSDVQGLLLNRRSEIKMKVENLLVETAADTKQQVRQLEEKYNLRLRECSLQWIRLGTPNFEVHGGMLEKVPPAVVSIVDMILSVAIGPFGILGDLIMRWLLGKIPFLRRIMPTQVAKEFLTRSIRDSLNTQMRGLREQIHATLEMAYGDAESRIKTAWDEYVDNQIKAVVEPLQRAATADAQYPQRIQVLKTGIQRINALLTQMPSAK